MKLVINENYIKKNKKLGNFLTVLSLGVLGLGLFFAFQQTTNAILYSYICLILGFILTQIGMYYANRFTRTPRYDQVIASAFEKLRHEYTFFVYSTPAPMLLTGPCRMWIPIPVAATGTISFEKGKWRQRGGGIMTRFMGQGGIGNPEREFSIALNDLQKHLVSKGIPLEEQPEFRPVMVVLLEKTILGDITEAPIPVIDLKELKKYVRREDRDNCQKPLAEETVLKINSALGAPTENHDETPA